MQRVMGSIAPEYMQGVYQKWNEIVNSNEGEALKKIIKQKHADYTLAVKENQKNLYREISEYFLTIRYNKENKHSCVCPMVVIFCIAILTKLCYNTTIKFSILTNRKEVVPMSQKIATRFSPPA